MMVVIGFMGAGKSTVGRLLAQRLGLPFADADQVIEQRQRRTVREIFAEGGERLFRDIEEATVADLLGGPPGVLSLGGGACGREATRKHLARHTVIYLQVDYDEAILRVGRDQDRPMLHNPELPQLYAARLQEYAEVATMVIATTGHEVQEIVSRIIERISGTAEIDSARGDAAGRRG